MENTLEDKLKFFTNYWGQFVLLHEDWNDECWFGVHAKSMLFVEKDGGAGYYLELRSLDSLKKKESKKMGYKNAKEALYWLNEKEDELWQSQADELRANGFATDFRDVTVEKQLEWGWIKIKK